MAKRSRKLTLETPDGPRFVSVEDAARLCRVTVRTAQRWRAARQVPPLALAILEAHVAGRLLPASWHGFAFDGDHLLLPDGRAVTAGELRAWHYTAAISRAVLRRRRGEADQLPLNLG